MFQLDQYAYDEVVQLLLADDAEYARAQENFQYVDAYYCQIAGSVLFAMRPNAELYKTVLDASIKIGDPSSCRDAVVALLQIKSPPDVAVDFLEMIDKHSDTPDADEIHSRILDMFYWLGTGSQSLTSNNAWPGYTLNIFYHIWFDRPMLMSGEKDSETGFPLTPSADSLQAESVSLLILEKMLDLFEQNNATQAARSIIAQLPLPDKDYLAPYRDRIIQAFISANTSSDEYVRQRVSDKAHQHYINQGA